MSKAECPLGEDCDLTLAYMMGAEKAKDTIIALRGDNERLRAALCGVLREWDEYRSDGYDGEVPFIVAVTMAGIARAAIAGEG